MPPFGPFGQCGARLTFLDNPWTPDNFGWPGLRHVLTIVEELTHQLPHSLDQLPLTRSGWYHRSSLEVHLASLYTAVLLKVVAMSHGCPYRKRNLGRFNTGPCAMPLGDFNNRVPNTARYPPASGGPCRRPLSRYWRTLFLAPLAVC